MQFGRVSQCIGTHFHNLNNTVIEPVMFITQIKRPASVAYRNNKRMSVYVVCLNSSHVLCGLGGFFRGD